MPLYTVVSGQNSCWLIQTIHKSSNGRKIIPVFTELTKTLVLDRQEYEMVTLVFPGYLKPDTNTVYFYRTLILLMLKSQLFVKKDHIMSLYRLLVCIF